MAMKKNNKEFAEVIESSLIGFCAQSWEWDQSPDFGSLVIIRDGANIIFGIVHQVQTGSIDSNRSPFPYKKTEKELKKDLPHIFEFLRTTFSCVIVGFREGQTFTHTLAPRPVKIHSFVSFVPKELVQLFFSSSEYLHVLFGMHSQFFNLDELLLALLRYAILHGCATKHHIYRFMQIYVLLIGNEYRRIKLFSSRVQKMSNYQ